MFWHDRVMRLREHDEFTITRLSTPSPSSTWFNLLSTKVVNLSIAAELHEIGEAKMHYSKKRVKCAVAISSATRRAYYGSKSIYSA